MILLFNVQPFTITLDLTYPKIISSGRLIPAEAGDSVPLLLILAMYEMPELKSGRFVSWALLFSSAIRQHVSATDGAECCTTFVCAQAFFPRPFCGLEAIIPVA
jgi:hypothetical protein